MTTQPNTLQVSAGTDALEHKCPEGDNCVVCVHNAAATAFAFQQASKQLDGETDIERHWRIADTAERYEASHMLWWGLKAVWGDRIPANINWGDVVLDFDKSMAVAQAYLDMTDDPFDEAVRVAYEALMLVVDAQYELLTGNLEISIDYVDAAEPYPTAEAQMWDVVNNGRIMISSAAGPAGGAPHPLLSYTRGGEYDRLRACHDLIGHVATGTGFDRFGEYVSWLFHGLLCGNELPCSAISTELHGQNSVLAMTGEAPQFKAGLLPAELRNPLDDIFNFGFFEL